MQNSVPTIADLQKMLAANCSRVQGEIWKENP